MCMLTAISIINQFICGEDNSSVERVMNVTLQLSAATDKLCRPYRGTSRVLGPS